VNIVVAHNALKGSLSATEAAEAMCQGIYRALPGAKIRAIPVADGGDGLIEALAAPLSADRVSYTVTGPLGAQTNAAFLHVPARQLAIIEMAQASGLALLEETTLDALAASSFGTGQLISAALDLGCKHIVLGIGGSATTDGATGLATALGVRFENARGDQIAPCGANLQHIRHIDISRLDERLQDARLEIACDVDNPLLGELGAARVYAPQKGASADEVTQLEQGLAQLAGLLEKHSGEAIRSLAGGGAAGGAGAGLVALFGATLKPGAELVMELLGVENAIAEADLVLTCEGRLDYQTRFGKAPAAVAGLAQKHGVPCIAIAGSLDESAYRLQDAGFAALFSLCPGPVDLQQAIENAAIYLSHTTEQIIRCQQSGRAIPPVS
jgi:glycerate kinase